ncbi:hypothetical protein KA005_09605 [bacterium]|nr:hypothetical protein [bacterium]
MTLDLQEMDNKMQEISPRSFNQMPKLWLRFFHMTEAFFIKESLYASNTNTFLNVLVTTVIAVIINSLNNKFFGPSQILGLLPKARGVFNDIGGIPLYSPLYLLVLTPINFYLIIGGYYFVARIFGGKAKFKTQAYLQSIIGVPLGIIIGLLSLGTKLSYIGSALRLLMTGVSIFGLILIIRVIKAIHKLSTIKAVGSVFILMIIVLFVFLSLFIALFPSIIQSTDNVYSKIVLYGISFIHPSDVPAAQSAQLGSVFLLLFVQYPSQSKYSCPRPL